MAGPNYSAVAARTALAGVVANYAATSGANAIVTGGTPQMLCATGEIGQGLFVQNPTAAADQGIGVAEKINVDWIGDGSSASATQMELQPGDQLVINAAPDAPVYVRAATSGHKFYAFVW